MRYTGIQFSFFRILLGLYLLFHFLSLIPYGKEVWSNMGMIPNAAINLTHGVFPNVLHLLDAPLHILIMLSVLSILAFLFIIGFQRQLVSIVLWYGWVCLFDRNNLIANPGLPFVGWLLLACTVIPRGEPFSWRSKNNEDWKMPQTIFYGAWIIMALSYSISGIDKLMAPSWQDGTAIFHLLENPLARDSFLRELLLGLPLWTMKAQTWLVLALEILFLPLALFPRTRFTAWICITLMHLGILSIVDFADLTIGMLMMHVFTFDARWMKSAKKKNVERIVFFDGICGMCNETVDLLMKEDRENVLLFAPLQGETAQQKIPDLDTAALDSIIYYRGGELFDKSTAILHIFRDTGGFLNVFSWTRIIPRSIRDAVYSYIALNRYAWFGKKEVCRMPSEQERGKLLN